MMNRRTMQGRSGYALLELLVATGVVLTGLLIAASLLRESQVLQRNLAIEHRDPLPGLMLLHLRRDLELATSVEQVAGILTVNRLSGVATYRVAGGCLERALFDAAGSLLGERCLYDRALGLRLLEATGDFARVEVRLAVLEAPVAAHASQGPSRRPQVATLPLVVSAHLRGSGPRRTW